MPQSLLRLIEKCAEYKPQVDVKKLPRGLRGIYVLYRRIGNSRIQYGVIYVGMAKAGRRGGIRSRLISHAKRKGRQWTHFSVFKVWDNIRDDEIAELEGLFRHIYRYDPQANSLNIQRGFRKLRKLRRNNLRTWVEKKPRLKKA